MPCPTWLSPDSAAVTDRGSLQPFSQHAGGRGNTPFYQMHFMGSGGLGAVGTVGQLWPLREPPCMRRGGFPLGARIGVCDCGHAGHLHRQEGSRARHDILFLSKEEFWVCFSYFSEGESFQGCQHFSCQKIMQSKPEHPDRQKKKINI